MLVEKIKVFIFFKIIYIFFYRGFYRDLEIFKLEEFKRDLGIFIFNLFVFFSVSNWGM